MKTENLTMRRDGIIGKLYLAEETHSSERALIILQGPSEDIFVATKVASLFRKHGITSLALFFYGCPGLPDRPVNIPLETISTASTILRKRGYSRIGIYGASFSGELALLAARDLKGSVDMAVALSPYTFSTGGGFEKKESDSSLATLGGKEIPWVKRSTPLGDVPEEARIKGCDLTIPVMVAVTDNNEHFPFRAAAKSLENDAKKKGGARFTLLEYPINSENLLPVFSPLRLIKNSDWVEAKEIDRASEDCFLKSLEFFSVA